MTRVSDQMWSDVMPTLRSGARSGLIDIKYIEDPNYRPTHVLDIYKMRRGRYKNVRIWTYLHLGTGERKDLFITNADNQPLGEVINLYTSVQEQEITNWRDQL